MSNAWDTLGWETVDSIINTPASTDDEGDRFGENPQTLYEGLKAGIWFKYGMTSTRRRIALSCTARTNIQTIIRVSGQQMVGEEYSNMYMAILESLVRAYRDWKTTS